MTIEDDLARVGAQEQRLRFAAFTAETAWSIGLGLRATALARGLAIAYDIHVNGVTLFHHAMAGTRPDNAEWIRRKRNLVARTFASSYFYELRMQHLGTTLEARTGMPIADYVAAGGGFPIHVTGAGCIGALVVSGLTGRADHDLAVEALAAELGIPAAEVALD